MDADGLSAVSDDQVDELECSLTAREEVQ